jgi:hypothetical protein
MVQRAIGIPVAFLLLVGVFIARGAINFVAFLAFGRLRLGESGCAIGHILANPDL